MSAVAVARVRHLASFTAGSALGLAIDVGGFWALVHAGAAPGFANAVSSVVSIVAVYLFVTRRTFRARPRAGTFLVFAAWYALNIGTVSLIIDRGVDRFGHSPLLWKAALVPVSFAANYAFNLALHDRNIRRRALRVVGVLVVLVLGGVIAGGRPSPDVASAAAAAPAGRGTAPGPQRLADLFSPNRWDLGRAVVVGGLGSSVGAGASLPDPGADAPSAYFAAALQPRVDPRGDRRWTIVNASVNGSTIHDGLARDWATLAPSHPDVVVLAYGMNDGAPAQFESGETYAGAMHDLTELITTIRASGAVPVLLTSPSPHTGRFDFDAPVADAVPQQTPVDTADPIRHVRLPGLGTVPESSRHAAVNEGMRSVATAAGADVIDVEPYWLRAVAQRGEDALFLPDEFVHPDLLGHRLGYHAAIDAWIRSGHAQTPAALLPIR